MECRKEIEKVLWLKTRQTQTQIESNTFDQSLKFFQDVQQLGQMSSPLRRHTKRFAGSVKNLIYRLYPQGVSSPQIISSSGTRLTDDDYCNIETPCKNSGRCYSTNEGVACDCAFTEFEGNVCEKQKPTPALSFFGHEWIGYDVTNHTASLVQNRFENISIQFRTAHPNGLLFTAGDRSVSFGKKMSENKRK